MLEFRQGTLGSQKMYVFVFACGIFVGIRGQRRQHIVGVAVFCDRPTWIRCCLCKIHIDTLPPTWHLRENTWKISFLLGPAGNPAMSVGGYLKRKAHVNGHGSKSLSFLIPLTTYLLKTQLFNFLGNMGLYVCNRLTSPGLGVLRGKTKIGSTNGWWDCGSPEPIAPGPPAPPNDEVGLHEAQGVGEAVGEARNGNGADADIEMRVCEWSVVGGWVGGWVGGLVAFFCSLVAWLVSWLVGWRELKHDVVQAARLC